MLISRAFAALLVFASEGASAVDPATLTLRILTENNDCVTVSKTIEDLAKSVDYARFTRALRQTVLENPGPLHRQRARRSLVKLLLTKQGRPIKPDCLATAFPWSPEDVKSLGMHYDVFDKPALRADDAAVRLVAANTLALSGTVPSEGAIADLLVTIEQETNDEARFEQWLALAAFADRSLVAVEKLQHILLNEKSCDQAQLLALSLPSHDLKLALHKRLRNHLAPRATLIRTWLRAKTFAACSEP